MLFLKLFLVPSFMLLISLVGKWRGAGAAGMLSGFPIIAGAILWFIYQENGAEFGTNAAVASLSGVAALSTFCFAYAWVCQKFSWYISIALSLMVYTISVFALAQLNLSAEVAALVACTLLVMQLALSPQITKPVNSIGASNTEMICRMVVSVVLVFTVTGLAHLIGEVYSGILASFPIAGSTVAIFTHSKYSAEQASHSLKAMIQGLFSMLCFFYLIVLSFEQLGLVQSFALASLGAILIQLFIRMLKKTVTRSMRALIT